MLNSPTAANLRQFDNLVHALDAVIHRDLKDRMLFLDPQSGLFRSFIGRIRCFHLPIHLEAKSAVHPFALGDRLRDDSSAAGGMVMVLLGCRVVVAI